MPTLINCADCPFTASAEATAIGGFDCADGSIGVWGGITQADCSLCSAWAQGWCGDYIANQTGTQGMSALQGVGNSLTQLGSPVKPIRSRRRTR